MGVSIVGWAHLPFGRLDGPGLEGLITRLGCEALPLVGEVGAALEGVSNREMSAVAKRVSILERAR